ncbi:LLM class flavin-dependent oxidoreductase [Actinospica durhamensis]|uniref:LLM class flavin-dependent oxidoreductase n=1 Tax=Actinospica durhamensis TaxID=1508375 RepID=A0A941EP16_9ACTN|nr:MupA/Atu3671 family FMN-dependent luciferase-like monooxygenase [Actinospica durhamensis]MBR7832554.1 LLM class flavin-dependent oxidoreductase [Actinospica durhamensis]
MDFSLFYFADDAESEDATADAYRLMLDGARFADQHGFTAVWTPERHFHQFGGLYPNPSVTAAAIAAVTERVHIRAGSVVAPLHHPIRIAEEWSVVDRLSAGRAGISFAPGWHATDFALRPESYDERRKVMFETLDQVRDLWRGKPIQVRDGAGEPREVRSFPRPVQPELPVWITSSGNPETFVNAGRAGAGLLTHLLGQDPDDLAKKITAYRTASAAEGFGNGHVVLMVHTFLAEQEQTAREQVREPLMAYLRSSFDLLAASSKVRGVQVDAAALEPDEIEFFLERSFDRYYADGGLLGTPGQAAANLDRFARLGVDEIACLIDFGIPYDQAMHSLHLLDGLRARFQG